MHVTPGTHRTGKGTHLGSCSGLLGRSIGRGRRGLRVFVPGNPHLNGGIVRTGRITGTFNSGLLFSSLGFVLPPGNVINVVNPGNTNGAALFHLVVKLRGTSGNRFRIKRAMGITCISRRRGSVSPGGDMCRIVSNKGSLVHVKKHSVGTHTCLSHFGFSNTSRRGLYKILSNNRHGHLRLTLYLGRRNGILLLSRPAGSVSIGALHTLRRNLRSFTKYTIIVDRSH